MNLIDVEDVLGGEHGIKHPVQPLREAIGLAIEDKEPLARMSSKSLADRLRQGAELKRRHDCPSSKARHQRRLDGRPSQREGAGLCRSSTCGRRRV